MMVYYEKAEQLVKLRRTSQVSFCQNSPLKIRGVRGSYGYGNNPLYPPYFKGDIEEDRRRLNNL